MAANAPNWNLSDLFDSPTDPRIETALEQGLTRAQQFAAKYRGRIRSENLQADELLAALREYESLLQENSKPMEFAGLLYAANTGDPAIARFMQLMQEKATQISVEIMFFALELLAAEEEHIERLLRDPALQNYVHFVRASRAFRDYTLSEPEERILEECKNSGSRAFGRLFTEVLSNHRFRFELRGEVSEQTESELLDKLRSPDREERRAAAESLTVGLGELERVLVHTFNTLLLDKAINDRLRGLPTPMESRHISNELDNDTVEMVMQLCEQEYPLCARYYRLKKQILGLDELTHYDRYAPLFETESRVDWDQAEEIVLTSFGKFSQTIREHAERFFRKGWIDAAPAPGKMGGAFCSYVTPDLHPYVFLNYHGKMDDVLTLAHELGHGVHASLSAGQTYLNYSGTLPLAELASTFGEMLVFDALQETATPRDRLAMYAESIEGAFATIFRQAAMYRFEQDVHMHRREKGEMTAEEVGAYWQSRQQAMFGDSVVLGEDHRRWWSYVPHFVHSPFYVYAYSFGELLVMSLYRMALEQGPAFEPKYVALLRAGGSKSPHELMSSVGIDLRSRDFWLGGFRVLEDRIQRFEKLWAEFDA